MDRLFLLQFACLIFMLINAFAVGASRLYVRWKNKRYERTRWMIFTAMMGMALQYALQMMFGFRAADDDLGAVVNILIYTPCFSLISMGIYNIEATHAKRQKMHLVCAVIYVAIIVAFGIGVSLHHGFRVGSWLYVMLALFCGNIAYCIYVVVREMIKRRNMLETMAATDILPYVRYSRASVFILLFAALVMPVSILSTTLLFIVGPFALLAVLFFNVTFTALSSSYTPTEELLDKEEEQASESKKQDQPLSAERITIIQNSLDQWCAEAGYKDSAVNMLTLSRTLCIPKGELTLFFEQRMRSTFRIWLSEIRFNAAKKMMLQYPDYSNDIISAECGFSSRTYLYRVFKQKEGCTPTEWRQEQTASAAS